MKDAVLIDYRKYRGAALVPIAEAVIAGLTNNPFFPNPTIPLLQLSATKDAYANALVLAASGSKLEIAKKNDLRAQMLSEMASEAQYVNSVAKGNRTALISSGGELRKLPQPVVLGTPENLEVEPGSEPGSLVLKFARPAGALSFGHMCAKHPLTKDTVWTTIESSRTSAEFTDLEEGQLYWFKAYAVGSKNQKSYSDVISQFVNFSSNVNAA